MPVSLTIRLRATRPFRPDTRQLHGLACALFESGSPPGHQSKFAVWPLRPVTGKRADGTGNPTDSPAAMDSDASDTAEADQWALRAAWLPDSPLPASAAAPAEARLGHVRCAVTEASHRRIPCRELAAGPPASVMPVSFRSPCFFAGNGSDVITPEPRLIIGSWWRRWNALLPERDDLVISEDVWREVLRAARLTEFGLRTQRRDSGYGRERAGFVGTATLALGREAPARARRAFGTLARFAEFCGTGAQTTHGFGATQVGLPAMGDDG